jgi:hypothetical protein
MPEEKEKEEEEKDVHDEDRRGRARQPGLSTWLDTGSSAGGAIDRSKRKCRRDGETISHQWRRKNGAWFHKGAKEEVRPREQREGEQRVLKDDGGEAEDPPGPTRGAAEGAEGVAIRAGKGGGSREMRNRRRTLRLERLEGADPNR